MTTRVSGNAPRPVLPKPVETQAAKPLETNVLAAAPEATATRAKDAFSTAAAAKSNVVVQPNDYPTTSLGRPAGEAVYETWEAQSPERSAAAQRAGWSRNAEIPLTIEDDGAYVDAYGEVLPSSMDVNDVHGLVPEDGSKPLNKTVFINGIAQSRGEMNGMMQQISNMTQTEVVGLYNATEGWMKDALQTVGDRLDLGDNPAVEALKNVILDQVRDNEPLRVVGYSQGSVIASRAIQDVKDVLRGEGMSEADVQAKLRELIQVETFATGHSHYPDGPSYVHHMNRADPITLFSFYALGEKNPLVDPGDDAAVHWFNSGIFNRPHSLATYEKNHERFEELVKTEN